MDENMVNAFNRFNTLMDTITNLKNKGQTIEAHKFYLKNIKEIHDCWRLLNKCVFSVKPV